MVEKPQKKKLNEVERRDSKVMFSPKTARIVHPGASILEQEKSRPRLARDGNFVLERIVCPNTHTVISNIEACPAM